MVKGDTEQSLTFATATAAAESPKLIPTGTVSPTFAAVDMMELCVFLFEKSS
jgi:hypothetical protein